MAWYVIYTLPRNEKKVATLLTSKGFEVYCPLQEEVRQWSDRKKKIQEPVFRTFLFVKLDDYTTQNVDALRTRGVVRFLWWNKKPGVVREEEIKAIQDFLSHYKDVQITAELLPGEQVTIMEGPLKDNTGLVMHTKGNKAYLQLKSLGLNMIATIPIQSIKKDTAN